MVSDSNIIMVEKLDGSEFELFIKKYNSLCNEVEYLKKNSLKIVYCSQEQYDKSLNKDNNTLYAIL